MADHAGISMYSVVIPCLILLLCYTWMRKKSKFPTPPGPRGLPLLGIIPFIDDELHRYFSKLTKLYGPIFQIKFGTKPCVVVSSLALAKEVLKDKDTIFANRDPPVVGVTLSYNASNLIVAPYGPHWRKLRMICVREMLNKKNLDAFYALRRREVLRTVGYIYSKVDTPVNIGEQMFVTMLNLILSILWGGRLNNDEERSTMGNQFRQVVLQAMELMGKINVSDLFPILARFDIQGMDREMRQVVLFLDRIFDSTIEERTKLSDHGDHSKEENKDFLQVLLQLKDEDSDPKAPFTMTNIKAILQDIIIAGTDTTSTAVEWAMAELMKHPEIMKKVQEEIENVVGSNKLVEESHISQFHYLDAVIKETLRLHPVAPFLIPRRPSETCTVGGYLIPKGTRTIVHAWALHRDPELWESPLEFKPDRFLCENKKLDYSGNDFAYIPFGSGRRICSGMTLAERMVPYVLASLVHSFEWESPDVIDLTEKVSLSLKKKTPLNAIPKPRLSDPSLYVSYICIE